MALNNDSQAFIPGIFNIPSIGSRPTYRAGKSLIGGNISLLSPLYINFSNNASRDWINYINHPPQINNRYRNLDIQNDSYNNLQTKK